MFAAQREERAAQRLLIWSEDHAVGRKLNPQRLKCLRTSTHSLRDYQLTHLLEIALIRPHCGQESHNHLLVIINFMKKWTDSKSSTCWFFSHLFIHSSIHQCLPSICRTELPVLIHLSGAHSLARFFYHSLNTNHHKINDTCDTWMHWDNLSTRRKWRSGQTDKCKMKANFCVHH